MGLGIKTGRVGVFGGRIGYLSLYEATEGVWRGGEGGTRWQRGCVRGVPRPPRRNGEGRQSDVRVG